MINLSIKSDVEKAALWSGKLAKQLPFATASALTSVAFKARAEGNQSMDKFFSNPVAYTKRAFLVEKADKRSLKAIVKLGGRQARYLGPAIEGGERNTKGFELKFLGQAADAARGKQLVPTSAVRLNSSGNVSMAQLKRISGLIEQGKGFVGVPRFTGQPFGAYTRSKRKLTAYFVEASPRYRAIFPFEKIVEDSVKRNWDEAFDASLEKALATAK